MSLSANGSPSGPLCGLECCAFDEACIEYLVLVRLGLVYWMTDTDLDYQDAVRVLRLTYIKR